VPVWTLQRRENLAPEEKTYKRKSYEIPVAGIKKIIFG
jgi:hypothetical protein